MFYKLTQIGNSVGFTVPQKLVDILGFKKGEEFMLEPDLKNRTVTFKPIEVAKQEVSKEVVEGMDEFMKTYSKAMKNLAKK
jgi:putative addiction module antidote